MVLCRSPPLLLPSMQMLLATKHVFCCQHCCAVGKHSLHFLISILYAAPATCWQPLMTGALMFSLPPTKQIQSARHQRHSGRYCHTRNANNYMTKAIVVVFALQFRLFAWNILLNHTVGTLHNAIILKIDCSYVVCAR